MQLLKIPDKTKTKRIEIANQYYYQGFKTTYIAFRARSISYYAIITYYKISCVLANLNVLIIMGV